MVDGLDEDGPCFFLTRFESPRIDRRLMSAQVWGRR